MFGIRLDQGPAELNVNFLGDPQCGINPTQAESLHSLQVTWHMECTDFLIPENTEMKWLVSLESPEPATVCKPWYYISSILSNQFWFKYSLDTLYS